MWFYDIYILRLLCRAVASLSDRKNKNKGTKGRHLASRKWTLSTMGLWVWTNGGDFCRLSGAAVWSTHRGHLLGLSPEILSKMNILLSTADNPSSYGLYVFSKSSELSCISFPNQHEMFYDRSRLDSLWKKGLESVRRSPATTQENRRLTLIESVKRSQSLSAVGTLQPPSGLTTVPLVLMCTAWTWNMLIFYFSWAHSVTFIASFKLKDSCSFLWPAAYSSERLLRCWVKSRAPFSIRWRTNWSSSFPESLIFDAKPWNTVYKESLKDIVSLLSESLWKRSWATWTRSSVF